MFKNRKALVENEKDSKIKCLRTDRGGEFTSKEFDELYKCMESKENSPLLGHPSKME